jgi:hypothetical protein
METINPSVEPPREERQPHSAAKWWTAAHRQRHTKIQAAKVILGNVSRYGGETAGPVIWARTVVRHDDQLRGGCAV